MRIFLTLSDIYPFFFFGTNSILTKIGSRLSLTTDLINMSGDDLGSKFSGTQILGERLWRDKNCKKYMDNPKLYSTSM